MSKNKAIITKTPPEKVEYSVDFEPWRFDSLIFDKGYDVFIDKSFRCPCVVKGNGNPLPDCKNCLGIGWVFTNRVETRIALQSINSEIKYENWTKTTAGTATITSRASDKLKFMDKIILRNVEGYYNEILRIKDFKNEAGEIEKCLFTNYEIVNIEDLMIFVDSETNLQYLKRGIDYELDDKIETKIKIINPNIVDPNLTATITYKHCLTYHVIDMNRDIRKVDSRNCKDSKELENMPIKGIARKAHYLFDNEKDSEAKFLIDNTKEI